MIMMTNRNLWLPVLLAASAQAQAQQPTDQPAEPQGPPPQQQQGPPPATAELMDLIRREPTVREVQKACVDYFRVNQGYVHSVAKRARLRWLVPEVSGSFKQDKGNTDSGMRDVLYVTVPGLDGFKETNQGTSLSREYGVSLSWQLPGLIFDTAELDAYSLVGVQESLLREVTTLYFTRRRMQVMLAMNPPQDDLEAISEALRVEELTSTLDALTNGLFTKRLSGEGEQKP